MTIPSQLGPAGRASGLKGTGYKQVSYPNMTSGQMDLMSQLLGHAKQGVGPGMQHLSNLAAGSPDEFSAMERPALKQFSQTMGNIASRFSGEGSGARRSSAFNLANRGAAQELAESLASQRMQYQNQAIQDLMGLSHQLMQYRPYETGFVPKKKGFWESFMGNLGGGIGQAGSGLALGYGLGPQGNSAGGY